MSYLSNLDEAFTWISKGVLAEDVMSAVSYNPAEIIHHLERRLTDPTKILDHRYLVPLTGKEHSFVHGGQIYICRFENGVVAIRDLNGARFIAHLERFYKLWDTYLRKWHEK